jgi:hypothetical protein
MSNNFSTAVRSEAMPAAAPAPLPSCTPTSPPVKTYLTGEEAALVLTRMAEHLEGRADAALDADTARRLRGVAAKFRERAKRRVQGEIG